jgi:hypothetical protein
MTIQLTTALWISGSLAASGSQHTLDEATEAGLIAQGLATRVGAAPDQGGVYDPIYSTTNPDGSTSLVDAAGNVVVRSVLQTAWADKPAAATSTGQTIRVTDVGGSAGSLWISDGAYWKPVSGRVTLGGSGEGVTGALDTAENSFGSFVLPGYAMGPNGCLNIVTTWSYTNSANNKVLRIRFGTMAGERLVDSTQTTTASLRMWTEWQNRNRVDQQAGGTAQSNSLLAGGIGGAAFTSAQDTTVDKTIFITGQKATGAESLILMRWVAELIVP